MDLHILKIYSVGFEQLISTIHSQSFSCEGPTRWTRPYFDCGRSNKWVISAVSPIVDVYPRHTETQHFQTMQNVAVSVTEIDFIMLDINQCFDINQIDPNGKQRNLFAGTDKCKPSTRCEPLIGFGFRRGGYQCLCQPGFRYPPYQDGPFKGYIIEKATAEEYANNFDCLKVERNTNLRSIEFDV